MSGHIDLAEAVARAAVEDLGAAYKKVRRWYELDAEGRLKEFVEKVVEEQAARTAAKKETDYSAITFEFDDFTAVDFFREESRCAISLSTLGIGVLPKAIAGKIEFINENRERLEPKIRAYRSHATRELKDKTN